MWDTVLAETQKRHRISKLYLVFNILFMIFVLLSLVCVAAAVFRYRIDHWPLYLGVWIPTAVCFLVIFSIWRFFKKLGADKNCLEPYVVKMQPMSYAEFIEKLASIKRLDIIDGGYSSYYDHWGPIDKGRFLCIISNPNQYGEKSFDSIMDKLYHDAKKKYEIENDTINSTRETIIIHINAYYSINEYTSIRIRRNARFEWPYSDIRYEISLDLSTGYIYLPVELSSKYGVSQQYTATLEYLRELFQIVE